MEETFDFENQLIDSCALWDGDFWILALGVSNSHIHIYVYTSSWEYANSLDGHLRTVRSLDFSPGLPIQLVSSSHDSTIRIWKFHDTIPESILERHGHFEIPQLNGSFKLEALLTGHAYQVRSVLWVQGKILSSSSDCTIKFWEEDKHSHTWQSSITLGQLSGSKNSFYGAHLVESE